MSPISPNFALCKSVVGEALRRKSIRDWWLETKMNEIKEIKLGVSEIDLTEKS